MLSFHIFEDDRSKWWIGCKTFTTKIKASQFYYSMQIILLLILYVLRWYRCAKRITNLHIHCIIVLLSYQLTLKIIERERQRQSRWKERKNHKISTYKNTLLQYKTSFHLKTSDQSLKRFLCLICSKH